MPVFDVSPDWLILIPPGIPAAQKGGDELSQAIDLLRRQSRLTADPPAVKDASQVQAGSSAPLIVLNAEPDQGKPNGFSWRLGRDRLEIYGASGRGLCKGIFDFLAALGLRWPRPGQERSPYRPRTGAPPLLPAPDRVRPWEYPLREIKKYRPTDADLQKRRRLFLDPGLSPRVSEKWISWAARNNIDGVVFPFPEPGGPLAGISGKGRGFPKNLLALAESYALSVETGGWDLSLLLPRRYFFPNPELFRMEQGRRIKKTHFCTTNPDTMGILKQEAKALFLACPEIEVFHLWPERGNERTWCACPSCRAFSPEEQNRMAVNCIADSLGALDPSLWASYYENTAERIDIPPRPNMFKMDLLPGGSGAEEAGLFWTGSD
jgi:hypothetical protein